VITLYTLFISTYDKFINIALLKEQEIIEHIIKESINSHSVYTMPMIKEILDQNNIKPKDLNEIEVVNGPGSFTGVRIGVTIAKTLAYTLNIPIKSISSLEALALTSKGTKKIITLRDIKGVYYGIFDENNKHSEPFNYLNNKEFDEFIINNNYQNLLIEETNHLDIKNIHLYLKDVKPTNPHHINPLYIKKIEVEK